MCLTPGCIVLYSSLLAPWTLSYLAFAWQSGAGGCWAAEPITHVTTCTNPVFLVEGTASGEWESTAVPPSQAKGRFLNLALKLDPLGVGEKKLFFLNTLVLFPQGPNLRFYLQGTTADHTLCQITGERNDLLGNWVLRDRVYSRSNAVL